MKQGAERLPAGAQDGHERGRRDDRRLLAGGQRHALGVARRRPAGELPAVHEPRLAVAHDDGAVGEPGERRAVVALRARDRVVALAVQLEVDRSAPRCRGWSSRQSSPRRT